MTTTQTISRDELEILAFNGETHTERALARMLLEALGSEPKTDDELANLLWYAQEAACHPDPNYGCEFQRLATPGVIAGIVRELQEYRRKAMDSKPFGFVRNVDNFSVMSISKTPMMDVGVDKPLYAAPPAPVAVPDALDQFALFMAEQAIKSGEDRDGWQGKASNAAHEYAQACRAAMLKAGPVTAWIKCSERMPDESQPVITVADGGVVQRTVYQFCDGVWSDWYDQYGDVKADAFTHWMPIPAAPEQEV